MKEQKTDDFVIGRHPAMAALKSGQDINKVFVQSGLKSDAIQEIVSAAKKRSIVVSQVPKTKLDLLSDGQNHQGVVLAVAAFQYAELEDLLKQQPKKAKIRSF